MDTTILRWITLLPLAIFMISFGYYTVFHTDKVIAYYEERSNIMPGSLLDRIRLAKPKQRFWMKVNGIVLMLVGPALIVLLVWSTIYDK